MRVTAFDLGDVPPEIEVKDVCEPLGEFYDDDDDDDDEDANDDDDGEDEEDNERKRGDGIRESEKRIGEETNKALVKSNAKAGFDAATASTANTTGEGITTAAINRLNLSNLKLPSSSMAGAHSLPSPFYDFHFPSASASGLNTPQLSVAGTHTPGIPGGASNLGYFHLPLSAGLSGTVPGPGSMGATTPMMAVAGIGMGAGASSTRKAGGSEQRRRKDELTVHANSQRQHRRQGDQRGEDERGDVGEKSSSVKSNARRRSPERRRRRGASRQRKNERKRRDGIAKVYSSSSSSSSSSSDNSDSDDSNYKGRGRRQHRRRRQSIGSNNSTLSSYLSTSAGTSASSFPAPYQPSPNDVQIVAHVRYSGNVRVSLTAEILLDYPMPSFVSIPLKLNITGLVFDGTAVLAYVQEQVFQKVKRQQRKHKRGLGQKGSEMSKEDKEKEDDPNEEEEKENKRVHFCFLAPEDTQALYPAAASSKPNDFLPEDGIENGNGNNGNNHDRDTAFGYSNKTTGNNVAKASPVFKSTSQNHNIVQVKGSDNNSPLHALRIESEIGQGENGKQVLKNVGKVERFVLEQVRRLFEEELVFPSYWTFLV